MSGETEQNISAWTIDSLHSHLITILGEIDKRYEQRFQAQEKAVLAALAAAEKAVTVAEVNAEKWRSNANEWRGSMDDRERNFARRDSVEAQFNGMAEKSDSRYASLDGRINDLTSRLDKAAELNLLATRVTQSESVDVGAANRAASTAAAARLTVTVAAVLVAIGSLIALVLK